ncbi:unnamed protein product [Euphydryas editha]|uniref:SCY1-like protein 2 n=1 Tax=Euphydryas editha TaxID=104508 RepID=A0AAU9UWG1_EUPED|nr:unnamed protein product [Euphydryas editha]
MHRCTRTHTQSAWCIVSLYKRICETWSKSLLRTLNVLDVNAVRSFRVAPVIYSPEVQLSGHCNILSDMFSLGLIICSLFNHGKSLLQANNNPMLYLRQIEFLDQQVNAVMPRIPAGLQEAVQRLLSRDPHSRPSTQLLPLINYFKTVDFMSLMNSPKTLQVTVTLLENLHIVMRKCTRDDVNNEIMPLLYAAMDNNNSHIQTASLIALQNITDLLPDKILHNVILGKVKIMLEQNQSDVKVINLILGFFEIVLLRLDRNHILEDVIPTLLVMRLSDPDIITRVVKLYKSMLLEKKFGLTTNVMATKMIPSLAPQTINPALNLEQFGTLMEGGSMPNTSSSVPFLLTSSMQSIRSRRPSACLSGSQGSGILQQISSGMVRHLPVGSHGNVPHAQQPWGTLQGATSAGYSALRHTAMAVRKCPSLNMTLTR